MLNITTLNDLFRHMEWADAVVWSVALASPDASNDGKLRDYLLHLHLVQRVFLKVWRGEAVEGTAPEFPEFNDAKSLMNWARAYYSEAVEQTSGLSEDELNQAMPLPWSSMVEQRLGRPAEMTTKGETALQVALHTTHHRGQVNARLREIGVEPPLVDYIVWLWLGRPAPQWP